MAKQPLLALLSLLILFALSCCRALETGPDLQEERISETSSAQEQATDPYDMISADRMLNNLDALTQIQAWSGWRSSATVGEQEALDFIQGELSALDFLSTNSLDIEIEPFRVYLTTEIWEASLSLAVAGRSVEVPANALRGPRDSIEDALALDTDGTLNDTDNNPVTVAGEVILIPDKETLQTITRQSAGESILWVNYALLDTVLRKEGEAADNYERLAELNPKGVIFVTEFSNQAWVSHGTYSTEGGVLTQLETIPRLAILQVCLEDLAEAGIEGWEGLQSIETASMRLDIDVLSPAPSASLIAHIPGKDPSKAVILGAHIDSANTPGALDDGSGSVVLLEIAEVLNQARILPALDLYLVWFGSEELGAYGSSFFVNAHQELLDQTVGMLQVDHLNHPIEGVAAKLILQTWPPGQESWPVHLQQSGEAIGITTSVTYTPVSSDNGPFAGYGVPHADLIYADEEMMRWSGGAWFAGHVHDPYDRLSLVEKHTDVLVQMAKLALSAALTEEGYNPNPAPTPDKRAVFLATHTELNHMTPAMFPHLGLAFENAGLDVDLVPHGAALSPDDLANAAIVLVLPVVDLNNDTWAGEDSVAAFSADEVKLLGAYVRRGGFLVITNSAHRLKPFNHPFAPNETWGKMNSLAEEFGVHYIDDRIFQLRCDKQLEHPLMDSITELRLIYGNGVPFTVDNGDILAACGSEPVVALKAYGNQGGGVLVLADLGLLGSEYEGATNPRFLTNLAAFAIQD